MGKSSETRLKIIRTAELLFAEHGVDAVSVADIHAAAEQRNHSAVQYHFDDKKGLVYAIVERHLDEIQQRWAAMIQLLESQCALSVRALCNVMVHGTVAKLDDPDNGTEFLLLAAELIVHRDYPLLEAPTRSTEGVRLMTENISKLINVPRALIPLRVPRVPTVLYGSIATFIRLQNDSNKRPYDREVFVSDLVDTLTALILLEPSEQTDAMLAKLDA